MNKRSIGIALCAICLLPVFLGAFAEAQAQGSRWSQPYRLSSEEGKASEGYLVADRYGYAHVFWTETLSGDQRAILKYSRFDGETWSSPNEIYVTGFGIRNVSPVVDQYGTLHIAWAEGLNGPAYYTHAPANNALSAKNWAQPVQIDIAARILYLRADSKGVFHILYVDQRDGPGVYYIRSEDHGLTWSQPKWLDPDILPNHNPDSLNFELDENDGLHAVWVYGSLNAASRPDWVRYANSIDGGHTWSAPYTIDRYVQDTNHNLTAAGPKMIVQGQTVHVVWAAGQLPYRYHRYSTDAGLTWSPPRQIFGDLHGQASDGLAVDRAGRVHFFGQIRYPQGIYHAYWHQSRWSSPSLIYLISRDGSVEGIGDRIHAHHTHPVVRAGNQLVLTFADGPAEPYRRLFTIHLTLDDIPPLETERAPVPSTTPMPGFNPTPEPIIPTPSQTAMAPMDDRTTAQSLGNVPRPDVAIWMALVPSLLLFVGTLIIRLRNKDKH